MTKQTNKIRELVVKDYFTPNIRAEVILDTLLTPYVAEILKNQSESSFKGELCYITKEMSVQESEKPKMVFGHGNGKEDGMKISTVLMSEKPKKVLRYGNRGTKIDYVLGDEEAIYLVELKTTDSSMKPEQATRYLINCHGKTFGQVFGNKLLDIMKEAFGKSHENGFPQHSGSDKARDSDEALKDAFFLILNTWNHGEKYVMDNLSGHCAEKAVELIRRERWTQKDSTRSRKYLYTAGQLLDYLHKYPGRTLWDKPLKLIYLTPAGICPSEEFKKKEYKDFYMEPARDDRYSFSLADAAEYLEGNYLKGNQEDEMALLLSGILKDIYPERKTT